MEYGMENDLKISIFFSVTEIIKLELHWGQTFG